MSRFYICLLIAFSQCSLCASDGARVTASDLAYALSTRYAPYADWGRVVDVDLLAEKRVSSYWRTAKAIRGAREVDALPLAGLHLALDPGHVGGGWAAYEGRDFLIEEGDFRVREGELVLEVAQRVREQLEALGAQVSLLREDHEPINPKSPIDYLEIATKEVALPKTATVDAWLQYSESVRNRAIRHSVVVGEILERARVVNEVIQPDALLSLHINAAPWPKPVLTESGEPGPRFRLVESNHVHVLIFGCLSDGELGSPRQQEPFFVKLLNGSGSEERDLGRALGGALAEATQLRASVYSGQNAICLDSDAPTVWARNLMMLRLAECPTVLLEPYIANSEAAYARIQSALATRARGEALASDDILLEYANAVVAGVVEMYE